MKKDYRKPEAQMSICTASDKKERKNCLKYHECCGSSDDCTHYWNSEYCKWNEQVEKNLKGK